jgi:hypothetical protein
MDMSKVSAGKLRAIGYDAKTRTLRVQLDDGSALEYSGIAEACGAGFKAPARSGAFTATISKKNSLRGAFQPAPRVVRILSTTCSNRSRGNPGADCGLDQARPSENNWG